MQFQVPQYIDIESRVFGSFTFKQFVYVIGGAGLIWFSWSKLPTLIALPIIVVGGGLSFALAFLPKEKFGRPFEDVLESAFYYAVHPKLYLWNREPEILTKEMQEERKKHSVDELSIPNISASKLKDMSWGLDVNTGASDDSDSE